MTRRRVPAGCVSGGAALAVVFLEALLGRPAAADLLRPSGSAVVRADAVALVLSGQDGGGLPLAVLATAPPAGSGPALVAVEAAGGALIAGHEGPLVRADVIVYVLGPGDETLAQAAERFTLDLDGTGAELARSGLRVAFALDVPPGEHRVRVLVRSETGALGLASADLAVAAETEPQLLPPILAPPAGRWITALSAADEAALAAAWRGFGAGGVLVPSSRPVLSPGHRELVMVARGYDGPLPGAVLEDAGGAALEIPLASPERLAGAPTGVAAWRAELETSGVEPGPYLLSLSWSGLRSPSIPVVVAAPGVADAAWPEIGESEPASGIELPPVGVAAEASPLPEEAIAAGYLGALRQLAAGDRQAALRSLYALETEVMSSFELDALELLERVESEALASLLEGAWTALLPVTLLHAEAAAGYRETLQSALVGHSEEMVLKLARTYVERVGGEEARRDASRILADVAGELRRQAALSRAEWMYRHALEIDPGNEDLALAIAAIEERLGRYQEAAETLEGERRHGLGREGRLRLALNLQRTGRRGGAERLLGELAREPGGAGDWIGVLAVEELARADLERKNPGTAAAELRRGLERWPGHCTLRLQLAFVLDRLGRTDEAAAILEEIAGRAAPPADQERVRYNEWPRPAADDRRQEMMERASERLAELARAFERMPPKDPR